MSANSYLASAPVRAGSSSHVDSTIRVVLADDHAIVRRNLRLLLDDEDDVDVVSEAETIGSVLLNVTGHGPHVLVLDLQLPGGSSIEAIRRLRQRVPATEVVVLTLERSPAFAQRAIDAGAIGFVLKDRADTELPEAVRRAARGDEFVSPHVAAGLEALRRTVTGDGLSRRETEVLRSIALGYTSAEIAADLHLSRRTIETHRANIHRKLGLATRAELVHFALRRKLVGV
jgi:two-component system response regulator NreC